MKKYVPWIIAIAALAVVGYCFVNSQKPKTKPSETGFQPVDVIDDASGTTISSVGSGPMVSSGK